MFLFKDTFIQRFPFSFSEINSFWKQQRPAEGFLTETLQFKESISVFENLHFGQKLSFLQRDKIC